MKTKTRRSETNHVEHLITRLTKRECQQCGRPIYRGHVDGEPTTIDRTHLNQMGELAALVKGCKTFQESRPGGRIFHRRPPHIEAGVPTYGFVLAEHRCGTRWSATQFDLRELFPSGSAGQCPY